MKTILLGSKLLQPEWQPGGGATLQLTCRSARSQEFRMRAAEALRDSWTLANGAPRSFQEQCLRRGVGPRNGMNDHLGYPRIFWACSLCHSASAEVVATALLTQSVESASSESAHHWNRYRVGCSRNPSGCSATDRASLCRFGRDLHPKRRPSKRTLGNWAECWTTTRG